jgi:hypothetical protein
MFEAQLFAGCVTMAACIDYPRRAINALSLTEKIRRIFSNAARHDL